MREPEDNNIEETITLIKREYERFVRRSRLPGTGAGPAPRAVESGSEGGASPGGLMTRPTAFGEMYVIPNDARQALKKAAGAVYDSAKALVPEDSSAVRSNQIMVPITAQ